MKALAGLAVAFGLMSGMAQAQAPPSLGDLSRKERDRKGSGASSRVLSNEEVEKVHSEVYENIQVRFAMPKGWDKPTPGKNIVISPCPGHFLPPAPFEPETVSCALAVGIDGPSKRAREDPAQALDGFEQELRAKAKRQVDAWKAREMGRMPAREAVFELDKPGPVRQMRILIAVHPQTGLIYMAVVLALPEHFAAAAPALDTVLASFEPTPIERPPSRPE